MNHLSWEYIYLAGTDIQPRGLGRDVDRRCEFGSPCHRDGETVGMAKTLGMMWNKMWRELM